MKTAVEIFLQQEVVIFFIFRFLDQKKGAFTHSFLLNFYIKNNHIFA